MKIFDYLAPAEFAFEWLNHFGHDPPVIISGNTVNYFGLTDADMRNDADGLVITSEIIERWPGVVSLGRN